MNKPSLKIQHSIFNITIVGINFYPEVLIKDRTDENKVAKEC